MRNPVTEQDALALLSRSSLPTVITEGRDDYRVMRRMENRLADLGIDFLPLSGKEMVLSIWAQSSNLRRATTIAIVDLDYWLYRGIPAQYSGDNLLYTLGYSIENDLLLDCPIENLLEQHELANFHQDLDLICADHAIQVGKCLAGLEYKLARHANQIINEGDKTANLDVGEQNTKTILRSQYRQAVRGKTVFELLVRQLSRPQRDPKIGYKQLHEFASMTPGPIFKQLELTLRSKFST